jgi:aminomethyltransferase
LQTEKFVANKTPLYEEHIKAGALIAPFAGWEMPIHYGSIIEETKHTRLHTSIFDIYHMGEFLIRENPSTSSLDRAVTIPVTKMKIGGCKYGFLLNEQGGIIDDLIVYRIKEDEWMIVVNASNEQTDADTIKSRLSKEAVFINRSSNTMKLDVQGPSSANVVEKLAGRGIRGLKYFGLGEFEFMGGKYIVSRTGYTGELGFEIYMDAEKAVELWKWMLENEGVKPAGLGARDILRLEMGYPLYGDELTLNTTPVEAGMEKFLDFSKEFIGKEALVKQNEAGVNVTLVGIAIEGRRTPRHKNVIMAHGRETGIVTSGVFSPHLNKGIGMAYVAPQDATEGREVEIVLEKGSVKAVVTKPPFIKNTSIRNQI